MEDKDIREMEEEVFSNSG
jgi:hypothetical protein